MNLPKPPNNLHLIYNAKIYSNTTTTNTWMLFNTQTGVIEQLGSHDPPQYVMEASSTDCKGQLVLPGLHDSHLHMSWHGEQLCQLNLTGCRSIQQLQDKLKHYRSSHPGIQWISGFGWEQDLLGRFPVAKDIDDVCRDVPVFLRRSCYHVAVVNQKLLDLAGINETHADTERIERYPAEHVAGQTALPGKPNGILKEGILSDVLKLKPKETKEERLTYIKSSIDDLLRAGVTSAHPCEKDTWSEFIHLHDNQQLPIRIFYCTYGWLPSNKNNINNNNTNNTNINTNTNNTNHNINTNTNNTNHNINNNKYTIPSDELCHTFPTSPVDGRPPMLHCGRIKFFADGALGPRTAALSRPYLPDGHDDDVSVQHTGDDDSVQDDRDDDSFHLDHDDYSHKSRCDHRNKGILCITESELEARVRRASLVEGFRVEVHVIGDRAVEMVLRVFERVGLGPKDRPVLIHCQILRSDLIPRMKRLGVIANVQPQFVNTDGRWINKVLPQFLTTHAYAWKTLLEAGVHVSGSSDAPIEPPQPLLGIFDAVFRLVGERNVDVNKNVYKPDERLTIHQAIHLYTTAAAFTAGKETQLGQLLPGYQADFIVIDRDIVADPRSAASAVVTETWVAGVRRWSFGLID